MKRSALALAAALAAALLAPLAVPGAALAQDKPAAKAAPVKLEKSDLDRGMKEAPAVQQASGQPCQVTAAAFRGQGSQKGADGKQQKVTIYETACSGGLGYILVSPQGGTAQAFDCLAAKDSSTVCALPQNADPKQGLAALATASKADCTVSDGRYVGTGKDGQAFYEVACGGRPGFVISRPASGTPLSTPCAAMGGTPLACTLTTKAQIIAGLQPIVQQSGRACQVSDARYIGEGSTTGEVFYEFGCGPQPGFVAVVDKAGKFKQAVECAHAQSLGGCKFTDATQSAAAENAGYAAAAAKVGYDCQVSKSRYIGTDSKGREAVELACSNRPDGAVALLSKTGAGSEVFDCVRAGYAGGESCKLTTPAAIYPKYSEALAAKGKGACQVSNAVYLGNLGAEQMVETACSSGARGFVIGFSGPGLGVKEVLTCSQARFQGMACKLPGDTTAK